MSPVQDLLVKWGRGKGVDHAAHCGFPRASAFARMIEVSGQSNPILDEDTHVQVDRAVSSLSDAWRQILVLYYVRRRPDSWIARRARATRQKVTHFRRSAEAAVEVELHNLLNSG